MLRAASSGEQVMVVEGRSSVRVASAGGRGFVVGGLDVDGVVSGEIDVVDGNNMWVCKWRDRQGNPL